MLVNNISWSLLEKLFQLFIKLFEYGDGIEYVLVFLLLEDVKVWVLQILIHHLTFIICDVFIPHLNKDWNLILFSHKVHNILIKRNKPAIQEIKLNELLELFKIWSVITCHIEDWVLAQKLVWTCRFNKVKSCLPEKYAKQIYFELHFLFLWSCKNTVLSLFNFSLSVHGLNFHWIFLHKDWF